MKSIPTLAAAALFATLAPLVSHAGSSCSTAEALKEDHSACGAHEAHSAEGAVYKATGSVKSVNKAAGKVTIAHEAIADLHWPAMTMQFGVSDRKLLDELAAGKKVDFRFVQRGSAYLVTAVY
jgi:Cu(I)/Ag(I) efflux system protein CusF